MKTLLSLALLLSFSAQAFEQDATEMALKVMPQGTYQGKDRAGVGCQLNVAASERAVDVTLRSEEKSVSYSVEAGSVYRARPEIRLFLSSSFETLPGGERFERVYRTIAVGTKTQYVVVENLDAAGQAHKIECVVSL